jgi:hypothetical protein
MLLFYCHRVSSQLQLNISYHIICSCKILINQYIYFVFLTCIFLSRRLFCVTVEISRAVCNIDVTPGTLTATDTCIGYHVTWFEASRKVILHTRYVSTCVGAGGGKGRVTKIKEANVCLSSLMIKVPDHVYVLG